MEKIERIMAKVYGKPGHRQRESFGKSWCYNWSDDRSGTRVVGLACSDITGTNDYAIAFTARDSLSECFGEIEGQISDGIFENSRVGKVEWIIGIDGRTKVGKAISKLVEDALNGIDTSAE